MSKDSITKQSSHDNQYHHKITMLSSYKNTYYKKNALFREDEPIVPYVEKHLCCSKTVCTKLDEKINQIKIGLNYKKDTEKSCFHQGIYDMQVQLRTSCFWDDMSQVDTVNQLWCSMKFPSEEHIYWILQKDYLHMEYYYGQNNVHYIFPVFYRGVNHDDHIKLEVSNLPLNSNQIFLKYDQIKDVSENTPDFHKIFDLSNNILQLLEKINVNDETTPKQIITLVDNEANMIEQFEELQLLLCNLDLLSHPVFSDIKLVAKRF